MDDLFDAVLGGVAGKVGSLAGEAGEALGRELAEEVFESEVWVELAGAAAGGVAAYGGKAVVEEVGGALWDLFFG